VHEVQLMALTITQANAVNHVITYLTGAGISREQAIVDLAELAGGAVKALHAGYTPERARAALEQRWIDTSAESWTDVADGREYDLTVPYRDAEGNAWTCVGWLVRFDGVPVPLMECDGRAMDIEDTIGEWGPLTADEEAVSA
jgi:hypothetical protein